MKKINSGKKGLITGLLMIGLSLFFYYVMHKPFESPYQYAIYTIYTVGIIWSILTFSNTVDNSAKFKEYFSAGFKMFIVVALMMVIYTVIFYKLNPQILESKIALNNLLAIKEGNHTPMEIEKNEKQIRSIFIPAKMAGATFIYIFLGALISTIASGAIMEMKKK